MTALRVLHIDDEPDIRAIVEMSFGLDPEIEVRGCGSGKDGLAAAAEDAPDLILLDVMMPVMDGPTTFARLRENPRTAGIPIIFMTARAQTREIEQFKSLGAVDVIAKPFDPLALVASVRSHLQAAKMLATSRNAFERRIGKDTQSLLHCLTDIVNGRSLPPVHLRIRDVAHGLAGAGGIFGYPEIGEAAANLEEMAITEINGAVVPRHLVRAVERLLKSINSSFPQVEQTRPRPNA
jgi:CheY-like chemotaxis protein